MVIQMFLAQTQTLSRLNFCHFFLTYHRTGQFSIVRFLRVYTCSAKEWKFNIRMHHQPMLHMSSAMWVTAGEGFVCSSCMIIMCRQVEVFPQKGRSKEVSNFCRTLRVSLTRTPKEWRSLRLGILAMPSCHLKLRYSCWILLPSYDIELSLDSCRSGQQWCLVESRTGSRW